MLFQNVILIRYGNMKNTFKQWLDLNRQELMDWYCEGTMIDKDFIKGYI